MCFLSIFYDLWGPENIFVNASWYWIIEHLKHSDSVRKYRKSKISKSKVISVAAFGSNNCLISLCPSMEQSSDFLTRNCLPFLFTETPSSWRLHCVCWDTCFLGFSPQWFDYLEIKTLCWSVILKLNIFIHKKNIVTRNVWQGTESCWKNSPFS